MGLGASRRFVCSCSLLELTGNSDLNVVYAPFFTRRKLVVNSACHRRRIACSVELYFGRGHDRHSSLVGVLAEIL